MTSKSFPKPQGGLMGWGNLDRKGEPALEFLDGGCQVHQPSKVIINASEACIIIAEIICNLHKEGESPTYICNRGHTHRLSLGGNKGRHGAPEEHQPGIGKLDRRAGI